MNLCHEKKSFIIFCVGLQHIHELNIVHLDIKPYNILFSDKVKGNYLNFLSNFMDCYNNLITPVTTFMHLIGS